VCGTNLWDESEQTIWVTLAVSKRGTRRRLVQRSFVVDVENEGAESSEVRRARHTKVNVTGESDVQATTTERAEAASEDRMRCCQGRPGPVDKINCRVCGSVKRKWEELSSAIFL
jgi:hypothetical protein